MSNKYPIDHDVPFDVIISPRERKFPFKEMKIGDSFFVGSLEDTTDNIRSAACRFTKSNPLFKFSVRRMANGTRTWRIAGRRPV